MSDLNVTQVLWMLAAGLNLVAFAAFGIDKSRSRRGERRIPEARLLLLALAGGTPGAYAGRRAFRHKTCKQPFVARLHTIAALQVAGLAYLAYRGF
ncbi:MAG: DUF1294 domain-containing protein [Novosphingobium sp.]